MSEFRNNDDYLDMWLAPSPKPRRYLSQYGTRRMFYALRQTITAKTPQAAGETRVLSGLFTVNCVTRSV